MRDALFLLVAAMALVAADGCDAKSALGPRSTGKREIEVMPDSTAKPGTSQLAAVPSANAATSQTAASNLQTAAPMPPVADRDATAPTRVTTSDRPELPA